MAETTIGNLTLGAVDGTTLLEQERTVNSSQVSEKVTSSSLANFVGTSHQFAGLSTTAKNLVGAINEAAQSGGGASVIQLTQAEYTALSTAEKMNGSIYKLTDKAVMFCLDEEYHALKELTSAQYEALSTAEQNNGTLYIKTDEETTASDIPMSSSDSPTVAEAIAAFNTFMETTLVYGTLNPTYATSGNIGCMKKGGCLTIRLQGIQLSTFSTRTTIGTVPVGYRPRLQAVGFIDATSIACGVNTDGAVWVDPGASGRQVWGGVTTVQGF